MVAKYMRCDHTLPDLHALVNLVSSYTWTPGRALTAAHHPDTRQQRLDELAACFTDGRRT